MSTVTTTTNAYATGYSTQRKADYCQNGVLWTVVGADDNSTTVAKMYYSTDDGASWTYASTSNIIATTANASSTTRNFAFFIDVDDYAHIVFKDHYNGYLYYRRGTPNAGRTAYTWTSATDIAANANGYGHPDIVVLPLPTGGWAGAVGYDRSDYPSYTSVVNYVTHILISSSGEITQSFGATYSASVSSGKCTRPSVAFAHTGDSKTSIATPEYAVLWSGITTGASQGLIIRRWYWNGSTFSMSGTYYIDTSHYHSGAGDTGEAEEWFQLLHDGTRYVVVGRVKGTDGYVDTIVHDWHIDTDKRVSRTVLNASSTNVEAATDKLNYGSAGLDGAGNVYLFGSTLGTSPQSIVYRVWNRSTGLSSTTTIDSTANNLPQVAAMRRSLDGALHFLYTDGSGSPYSVVASSVEAVESQAHELELQDNLGLFDSNFIDNLAPRDVLGLTDALDVVLAFDKQVPVDVAGLTDTVAKHIALGRTDTESVTSQWSSSGLVSITDGIGITDAVTPVWGPMQESDMGMVDWLTIRFTHGVVLDDTATLTDTRTFARDLSRTHDDTLGITDSRILGRGWNIPVEDLIGTSDSRTFTYDFGRVLSDTLGLTDFRNIDAGTRFTVDHTDNVGLTDGMVATDIEADGLDWLNLSDQVDITFISAQHWTVEQDDSLGITDYTDRAITTNVLLEETANITDVLAKARAVTIVDTEQTSDTRGFARSYTATDAMGLSDSRVTSEGEGVLRSDTENITDTASRTVTFDRNSDDGTGLTDGLESWDIGIFGEEEETLEDYVRIDLSLAAFDYTHTQPDTVGLTDSLVLALNYDRDMTDSLGVTDSTASTGTYIRNFAENVGLVDTARPNPWLTKEDPVAINDSLTRDIAKQITDAATLSDTGMVTAEDNVLSYYEDLHVTDGAQTTVVYIRDITDEMSLRDTRTAGTDTDAEEMSNLGITDELAFSFDYGKVRDDTAEVTDSTDRVVVFSRSTTDDIGIEDITGTAMELSRAADDTLSVTDSFRVNPDVTLIDGTVLDDSLLTEEFNNIFDSGTVGLSDSLVLTVDRLRPHADSESVIDSLSMDRTANSTDDLALLDATEQATGRLVTDPQGITDIGTPVVSYGRPQADSVGLTDSLSFAFEYERVLADDISNSDATTSAGSGAQNVNDNETLTDSLNIVSTYIKSIDETVGVEDSYNFEHARAVADLAGITDTRSKDVSKVLAEQAGSTDITTTGFGEVDEHRDSVGITDTLVVSQGRNIALHDNEALADNAGLSITVHLADQIGLADSTIQSRDYGVMLTDPIGLQDGQDKATSRTLMDDATASDEVVLLKFDAVPFIGWGTGI